MVKAQESGYLTIPSMGIFGLYVLALDWVIIPCVGGGTSLEFAGNCNCVDGPSGKAEQGATMSVES